MSGHITVEDVCAKIIEFASEARPDNTDKVWPDEHGKWPVIKMLLIELATPDEARDFSDHMRSWGEAHNLDIAITYDDRYVYVQR